MHLVPWLSSWKRTVGRKSARNLRKVSRLVDVEQLEQRLLLTVNAVNDLTYTTNEDTVLSVAGPGVLANDPAGTGTSHAILTNSAGLNGATLTLNDDGSFTLDPTTSPGLQSLGAGQTANISFTYDVLDDGDNTVGASALVVIAITGVNDAPLATNLNQTLSYTEDAPSVAIGDIVVSDTDNNASITATLTLANPTYGTLTAGSGNGEAYTAGTGVWTITGTKAQVNAALAATAFVPAANNDQNTSIAVSITDGIAAPLTGSIALNVTAVNDLPTALGDAYTLAEDTTLTVSATGVLGNDTDPDTGAVLTASLIAGPSNGSLTFNSDGSFTYTPNADFNGSDSFTYVANDGTGNSNTATVALTVTPVNDPPVAADDSYSTAEDTTLSVTAAGVLGNDTDVDGDSLIATLVTGPAHGLLSLSSDGSFTYTPAANYNGTDSFTYVVNDGTVDGNTATVNLTITAVNDLPVANNDAYAPTEDTPFSVAAPGVLGNDTDIDADTLTATVVAGPAHGSLTLNPDGSFVYTPDANYDGTDSFTYVANDGTGNSNTATVNLTLTPVNDAPVANDDSYSIAEDNVLSVSAAGVLGNDTDVEGDSLTATLVAGPSHGNLAFNSDGSFTYTPAANYNGTDSFTYVANDGTADGNTATVNLTITAVNDAPVANGDSATTAEDTPLTVVPPGLLANDTDVDNDPLSVVFVAGPAHGTLNLNTNGSYTYTPDADYNGTDTFTYKAFDGTVLSVAAATVTITITAVNDAPVANNDSYSVAEDTVLSVSAAGVLGNDTDVEGDPLTATLVANASHGNVSLNSNGSFTYTPAADYNGTDSFTYVVNDGTVDGNTATVNLTITPVNDAPVANDDSSYTVAEDGSLNVSAPGILANDTDVDGDTLSTVLVGSTSHGSLTLNFDGSFTYTPDADYNGTDSFTYMAFDGTALSAAAATVTITVTAVNDAPVANGDSYSIAEDTTLSVSAAGVLGNDTDVDGDSLSAVLVTNPTHGSVTLNADGSFTYTPDADYNGTDSFTYQANDGTTDSNIATVSLTITAVNDAPVAVDDAYSVNENDSLTVAAPGVIGNDTDVDGDSLTASRVSGPSNGSLTFNSDGSFTYTPNAEFHGTDSFTYTVNDGTTNSALAATVTITINPETTVSFGGGALTISTTGDDSLVVSTDGGGNVVVLVDGTPDTSFGTIAASSVTSLIVNGGTGDNWIDLSGVTTADFTSLTSVSVDAGDGDDTVVGSQFNDSISGGAGADFLIGAFGDDTVDAGDGNDSILGGAGRDSVTGGAGNDTVNGQGGADYVVAGDGDDSVNGGVGNDTLNGGAGNDSLDGYFGNDWIIGGAGQDFLNGGIGNDKLNGQGGADFILGGDGDDYIDGNVGNDVIDAGAGNDVVLGGAGNDLIYASGGNDTVRGGLGNDTIFGDGGNDYISGNAGNDSIDGGDGNDSLAGGNDIDVVRGGTGADVLEGNAGSDDLDGGADGSQDTLAGGTGSNSLNTNSGEDLIDEAFASNTFGGNLDII
jgi:VCBS repeat-containing protein